MRPSQPTLGSLLRHLVELLDADVELTYRNAGLDYKPRFTPIMRAVSEIGPSSIREIAVYASVTHSAASQTVAEMVERKLVLLRPGADARERIVHLTARARSLLPSLRAFWKATNAAADELSADVGVSLSDVLAGTIRALEDRPFVDRIASKRADLARIGSERPRRRSRETATSASGLRQ